MSRMLPFAFPHSALGVARSHLAAGRKRDAVKALEAAVGSGGLSHDATADAHQMAAGLHRQAERYSLARKHLRAALAARPRSAALHHELGLVYQDAPSGCDRKAAKCFKMAAELEPRSPAFRAAFGRALVRINYVGAGLKHLKTAVELAPTNADVLTVVLDGLREAGRSRLAETWLTAARFRAAFDPAMKRVWNRARFDAAREGQGGRVVAGPTRRTLPFVRIATVGEPATVAVGGGVVRRDLVSRAAPHVGRLRAFRGF